MTRSFFRPVLATLLSLAVLSAPAVFAEDVNLSNSVKADLDKISVSLAQIKTMLETQSLNTTVISDRVKLMEDDVKTLKEQVRLLEQRVLAGEQQTRTAESPRISRSLDPVQVPRMGTIRLDNRSGVSATVMVNNLAYPLAPFQTRFVTNQTAGTFTYEVLADGFGVIQPLVARTLRPAETFTISIN